MKLSPRLQYVAAVEGVSLKYMYKLGTYLSVCLDGLRFMFVLPAPLSSSWSSSLCIRYHETRVVRNETSFIGGQE